MIVLSSVSDYLLLLMYPLEAVFLVFMSKKCFFDKLSVWKAILIFMFSPQSFYFIAYFITRFQFGSDEHYVLNTIVNTLMLFTLLLIFTFIYIRIVKAKNRSIAFFMYLSSAMLVPGLSMAFDFGYKYPYLLIVLAFILNAAFYYLVGRSVAELSQTKQDTKLRMFVTLTVTVFVYRSVILFIEMFLISLDTRITDMFLETIKRLSSIDDVSYDTVKEIAGQHILYADHTRVIIILSDFFILLILIGAFHVITRNIMYTNEVVKAHHEVKTLAVEMMEALAHTIDAKDKYTRGHSVRVANYSKMLAARMGLSDKECEDVYYYGLLHDLGKIGVPNDIINSKTKLTDDQYQVIKKHPEIGYDILAEVQSRPDLTIGARWHHERYDGKGYPDGKKGDEIPLLARIIAVADSYDAMTSNRSYRQYLPQDIVREEIRKNAGIQFDPEIAKLMVDIIDEDKEYKLHE